MWPLIQYKVFIHICLIIAFILTTDKFSNAQIYINKSLLEQMLTYCKLGTWWQIPKKSLEKVVQVT